MGIKLVRWGLSAVVLLLAATALLYDYIATKPLLPAESTARIIELAPGMSTRQFAQILVRAGMLSEPYLFELFVRFNRAGKALQAGEYEIMPGMTATQLLKRLTTGEVVQHQVTFIEGWTIDAVLAALLQSPDLVHLIPQLSMSDLLKKLALPYTSLEGWIFPDTYHFPKGTSDLSVLSAAYHRMQAKLEAAWLARLPDLVYDTPYEALIAASIIEKETAVPAERRMIAGVIQARLRKGMLLQVDPTVIYGLGKNFSGRLSKADLMRKTPYNTYRQRGLPPTPIAMPGQASIDAVLHPTEEGYLYFVSRGDGSHFFSKTLAEHNQAVKEYQLHDKSR